MIRFMIAALSLFVLFFAHADEDHRCRDLTVPVEFNSHTYDIHGTLCRTENDEHQLDVLVHGGSYTKVYWDWPVQPGLYSYVRHALAHGRSTFAYDRLGVGENAKVDSTKVDVQADADVLHQIIQHFTHRRGFKEINVVGHSFGSDVVVREQSQHNDATRVVITGMLHAPGPGQTAIQTYPAFLDPLFVGKGLDAGWLTTVPNTRGVFYYLPTTDPAVLAFDEAHKGILSLTQTLDALNDQVHLPPSADPARFVAGPVLAISGQFDTFACGIVLDCNNVAAVAAYESAFYPASLSFTAEVVLNTGHDLNLHRTVQATYGLIDAWIETH